MLRLREILMIPLLPLMLFGYLILVGLYGVLALAEEVAKRL